MISFLTGQIIAVFSELINYSIISIFASYVKNF